MKSEGELWPGERGSLPVPPRVSLREAQSEHFTKALASMIAAQRGEPIDVSFRGLVGPLPADEGSHSLFPYPARLVRHIPRFLLGCRQLTDRGSRVLDPFCGSGTVLLEAQAYGFDSFGIDSNPLAAIIARVKVDPHRPDDLIALTEAIVRKAKSTRARPEVPAAFLNKWFSPEAISVLSRIRSVTEEFNEHISYDFLRVVFALAVRKFSFADRRIPVPVIDASRQRDSVGFAELWKEYARLAQQASARVGRKPRRECTTEVVCGDARSSESYGGLSEGFPSLVVTSPPYGAAQKYLRSTSLELGWLGLTGGAGTISLERASIGREHLDRLERQFDPSKIQDKTVRTLLTRLARRDASRASIYSAYFQDMSAAFAASLDASRGVRTVALVAGTNVVAGETLDTHNFLAEMIRHHDFKQVVVLRDKIRGRTLMTKRHQSGSPLSAEYVHLFMRD